MNDIASGIYSNAAQSLRVCEHCDTVYRRRLLARGEVAQCLRCGATLERHQRISVDALLAIIVTAMIAFVMANAWPIITLSLNGQHNSATLWGMIVVMWQRDARVVSVLAALTLFFFPLVRMLMLGWVLLFARSRRRAPGFAPTMVALHHLRPWTMSEVFVLGALVSMVKAHLYFGIQANPGIYGYALLTVMITLLVGVDLRQLWDVTADPRP